MGNCFGSQLATDPNPSSTNPSKSSTPGTSHNYSSNGGGGISATDSSAGRSRFSAALSEYSCVNGSGEILPTSNLQIYSFADLRTATKGFKSDMVLGVGGFGTVYKGWVDEKNLMPSKVGTGMMVAIKKLNPESTQGFDEWQISPQSLYQAVTLFYHYNSIRYTPNFPDSIYISPITNGSFSFSSEVTFLGRLSHPNLVRLLGYCWEDKELLLVYEFMQKGSLENHLFRRSASIEPLSWDIRLKVAIGAAKGLTFLHTSEKQIIYRDFKASNILLDGSYNAKLSDFGLAKVGPSGGESHVTTRVMGTYGYAAPEYIATGHLYVKSDVYGFGVVLLEMMTGLRAHDMSRPAGQTSLVDWMKPLLSSKRKLKTIMDARIEGQYSAKAALLSAQLTLKCLEPEPKKRPSMKEVGEALEQIAAVEKPKESRSRSAHPSSSHQNRQSPRYPR